MLPAPSVILMPRAAATMKPAAIQGWPAAKPMQRVSILFQEMRDGVLSGPDVVHSPSHGRIIPRDGGGVLTPITARLTCYHFDGFVRCYTGFESGNIGSFMR